MDIINDVSVSFSYSNNCSISGVPLTAEDVRVLYPFLADNLPIISNTILLATKALFEPPIKSPASLGFCVNNPLSPGESMDVTIKGLGIM